MFVNGGLYMRRYLLFLIVVILLLSGSNIFVYAKETAPIVSADSAILMDATTGTILYSKNMDDAYPPASTTKIMTALLTLENSNLDDIVTIGKNPPFVDGSKVGIFEGEEISVKNLLYGMLLLSGNDCAEALAEHVSGSSTAFAELMNKRAKELGAVDTNFINPSGLYNENHKSSAKDLALIMKELIKHPEFREISSTFSYKIPPTNKHPQGINLANENKLINKNSMYYYEGADAGKTGYTIQSSHSYVASAMRNGQRLILALVHDKNKRFFEDSKTLFDYGFNNFQLMPLYKKNDLVTTITEGNISIPLLAEEDYYYVRDKSTTEVPKLEISDSNLIAKSFAKGDKIAEASMKLNNEDLPKLPLYSGIDHGVKPVFNGKILTNKNMNYLLLFVKIPLGIFSFFILLRISIKIWRRKRRQRKIKLYENK
jgi:serine-type D-Ala-D-Ala carboxypeptidase (penicillin-binding protein 5/6)